MNVYVDESGDLGFTLDKPFRQGGSSRFLTIAFLLVPKNISHLPARIIKEIYIKRNRPITKELKGVDLNPKERLLFSQKVINHLNLHKEIEIFTITAKKINVEDHIRQDPNKLYNYMIGLVLPDHIKTFPLVTFIPDQRSIRVKSQNSLTDYLKIKLWFDLKYKTRINDRPRESYQELNLQFIDMVSHIIWGKHEDGKDDQAYRLLGSHIEQRHLFF